MSQGKRAPLAERFWEHVDKRSADECWPWLAAKNNCGYGTIGASGKMLLAHRVSWELHHGPIPPGMIVLHGCDRPDCVNPGGRHLRLGTQAENIEDCLARGRWTDSRGEKHGNARLTAAIVAEIRALAPTTAHRDIAARFRITADYVSRIARRKAWRHTK